MFSQPCVGNAGQIHIVHETKKEACIWESNASTRPGNCTALSGDIWQSGLRRRETERSGHVVKVEGRKTVLPVFGAELVSVIFFGPDQARIDRGLDQNRTALARI